MDHRSRRLAALGAIPLALAVVVAGCSQSSESAPGTGNSPGASAPIEADPAMGHVHNLLIQGEDLLLGTHSGLWRQTPGAEATLVSEERFDVMGLTGGPSRYLASGHPAPGQPAPGNLGLIASTDGGRTWQTVSLSGEADFHRLATSGDLVLGVGSGNGELLRSLDSGTTWTALPGPAPFGLAINPADDNAVIATTRQGPMISSDTGSNFAPLRDAPPLIDIAWTTTAVYGVSTDGRLHRSTNGGRAWESAGSVNATPLALTAEADRVVVLAGGTVWESQDDGKSFTARITSFPGDH